VRRWLKRFWLRYLMYCKEHWFIAASIMATLLWVLWQAVSILGPLLEVVIALF
jgi:hypothetical protein